ncbi:MAG TPA: ThiF family adenylyltransferase [Verrucomicrobiae bacterium]|jgi:molybdopterin/thiamine biosynthesis adenylyltransferase|nr:ThiF family adenylyltransferase [Verrucomicrobiae bacterium]
MSPLVYLLESQLRFLLRNGNVTSWPVLGQAYAWDNHTVIHGYTQPPSVHPAGQLSEIQFHAVPTVAALQGCELLIPSILEKQKMPQPTLLVFLALDADEAYQLAFLVLDDSLPVRCTVKLIPTESDLYSRSKGLLETDVLAAKTVGIVGLGSGGSPIAVELAKAGIGHFVLIDFDRLELSNVARHVCGTSDLGRFKTFAVRDAIHQRNPHAHVRTLEIDVNLNRDECSSALTDADLIICASDNDRSRFFLNEIALKFRIPAIFGRAITRAAGGDVLRVRPFNGPCYSCLYSQNVRQEGSDDEEISQTSQAKLLLPDYTSEDDIKASVQVGLSSDIVPISNFMTKLALVELSKGLNSGISGLEDDFVSDFYIWANRRDGIYQTWNKLGYHFDKPTILRWYGAKVTRDSQCMVCGN